MTYATIDGHPVSALRLHVPARGVWYLEADLLEAPELAGAVTVTVGALELAGTIDPTRAGTHGLQRRVRVIGGGGGWSSLLAARAYHNDAGVRAAAIVEDAAREAGEQLGAVAPELERIGAHYVRQAGPAARALEDVIGGVSWWVGYDGVTVVGAREETEPPASAYEVLDFDARRRIVTLAIDDLAAVGIGSVLSARLDEPQTVRELDVEVTADSVRAKAWTGGSADARGRLAGALRSFIDRSTDARLHGLWRYRVVESVPGLSGPIEIGAPPPVDPSERVHLQAINTAAGLPNVLPVSFRPGVAGVHSRVPPGVEVLVQFVEGDRTRPVVTHFVGKREEGFEAQHTAVSADVLRLGSALAVEPSVKGNSQLAVLRDVLDALNTLAIDVKASFVAVSGDIDITDFALALTTASDGLGDALSEKVFVE